jgi:uncharacterized protein YdeI (YjbR/CyaY-like superfamily)
MSRMRGLAYTQPVAMNPKYFSTPEKWRAWLEKNHARMKELWVGFHKKASGKPSITWPESVDEALCYGWIDGLRKSVNETSYRIRFTPRRARSTWSAVNIQRARELKRQRRMRPTGLQAFEGRDEDRSVLYSSEQRKHAKLDAAGERQFRANARAWKFFEAQAPGYRRIATYWVISAKKEETRKKRLEMLIECSAKGRRIGPLARDSKKTRSAAAGAGR